MKKILTILLSSLAISALANTTETSGAYIGLDAGIATTANYSTNLDSSNNFATALTIGYAFNPYLATEFEYLYVAPNSTDKNVTNNIKMTEKINNSFSTIAVKGILPLGDSFNLFAKVGAGLNYASFNYSVSDVASESFSSTNFTYLAGVGIDYNISPNVKISLADTYYIPTTDAIGQTKDLATSFSFGKANFASLGIAYTY